MESDPSQWCPVTQPWAGSTNWTTGDSTESFAKSFLFSCFSLKKPSFFVLFCFVFAMGLTKQVAWHKPLREAVKLPVASLGAKGPLELRQHHPVLRLGQLECIVQVHVQASSEYLQGGRCSGEPAPGQSFLPVPPSGSAFLTSRWTFLFQSLDGHNLEQPLEQLPLPWVGSWCGRFPRPLPTSATRAPRDHSLACSQWPHGFP